ncbi:MULTISPECIES: hypothetical protein [Agrobacterium tumefaciens complex]|uniref:Uncharacterized protein n=1 Tax=Agrobacterium tomkonis CFBP 6623 TaxID=1183432 RepID=A0A1S7PDV1_9HYPH|nr:MULTISPECIES: hypothetical protein [Agrobacterium tumefaciens complex]CUX19954.1 conserved hypothetical protein [Agrobacterium tomkonis CFBP 6623]
MHTNLDTRNSVQVNARHNVHHFFYRRAMNAGMEKGWYDRLVEAIKADGRSERAISLEAKCGPNYVQQMISDGKRPTVDKLMSLLDVLGEAKAFEILTGQKLADEDLEFIRLSAGLDPAQKRAALAFFQTLLERQDTPTPFGGSQE